MLSKIARPTLCAFICFGVCQVASSDSDKCSGYPDPKTLYLRGFKTPSIVLDITYYKCDDGKVHKVRDHFDAGNEKKLDLVIKSIHIEFDNLSNAESIFGPTRQPANQYS